MHRFKPRFNKFFLFNWLGSGNLVIITIDFEHLRHHSGETGTLYHPLLCEAIGKGSFPVFDFRHYFLDRHYLF